MSFISMRRTPALLTMLVLVFLAHAGGSSANTVHEEADTERLMENAVTDANETPDVSRVAGGQVLRTYHEGEIPVGLSDVVDQVLSDAATEEQVDAASVSIVLVQEVIWSDTSLGCPAKGMSYAQVITEGLRLLVSAGDELIDYRTQGLDRAIRCRPWGPVAVR